MFFEGLGDIQVVVTFVLIVAAGVVGVVWTRPAVVRWWPTREHWLRRHRLEIVLVGLIVAVAAGLRLWNLARVGFGGDEAVYAGQAAVLSGDDEMRRHFILASRGNSNLLLYQSCWPWSTARWA